MRLLKVNHSTQQSGFIIITTLILLIMITVLAVSLTARNSGQTQMVTNTTDSLISFQKAEGALNQAVSQLVKGNYTPSGFAQNSSGLYLLQSDKPPVWSTINWNSDAAIKSFGGLVGPEAQYIIEQLPSVVQPGQSMTRMTRIYRVTGRVVDQNGNSSVLLQTTIQMQ